MACEYSHRTTGRRVSVPLVARATASEMDGYIGQTTSVTGASA